MIVIVIVINGIVLNRKNPKKAKKQDNRNKQ